MNPKQSRLKHLLTVLAPLGAAHWTNHYISRLYLNNIPATFQLADLEVPANTKGMKFFLDLNKLTWHLTGEPATDAALIPVLNDLADCRALTKVYQDTSTVAEAEVTTASELASKSDAELIALVQNDAPDPKALNWQSQTYVWATKIALLPDLSAEVINAIVDADFRCFENTPLLSQKNFPVDAWVQRLVESGKYEDQIQRLAENSEDPRILKALAKRAPRYAVQEVVDNEASDFQTLLIAARRGCFGKCLFSHPEMTDGMTADLVPRFSRNPEDLLSMASYITSPGPETLKAFEAVTDDKCRLALVRGAEFLSAEILDRFTEGAKAILLMAILQHPNVATATVLRFTGDGRSTVCTAARDAFFR